VEKTDHCTYLLDRW